MKPRLLSLLVALLLASSLLLVMVEGARPVKKASRKAVKTAKTALAKKPAKKPAHPVKPHGQPKPAAKPKAVKPKPKAVKPIKPVRPAVKPKPKPVKVAKPHPVAQVAKPKRNGRAPAELSNSFIITTFQDLEPQMIKGRMQTPCEYAIGRARSMGGKHFSIVNTAYWIGGPGHVEAWAYKDVSPKWPQGFGYERASVQTITRWKDGLQKCFRAAIKAGFTGFQILNHIDDGGTENTWRNLIDFDPLVKYGGFSYEDVVVRPSVDALRTVTRPTTKVWYMVAGEMGRSMFRHPVSYMRLISKYRGTLARGKQSSHVKIGLALHWNKVCGNCFFMPYTPTAAQYNATYTSSFRAQANYIKSNYVLGDLKRLFEIVDVLGISHYAPMPIGSMTPNSFEMPFYTTAFELRHWGVDLKKLILKGGKDFLFSEVGLGGAAPDGRSLANDLNSLTQGVENGIWAVYNVAQDPWRRQDFRGYRRRWFHNLIAFLRKGGSRNVKINAAFVWSVGSFDVAAVHPISTSREGTYADMEIVGWMKRLSAATPNH